MCEIGRTIRGTSWQLLYVSADCYAKIVLVLGSNEGHQLSGVLETIGRRCPVLRFVNIYYMTAKNKDVAHPHFLEF